MSARAEIHCFDREGLVSSFVMVGEDGYLQVMGNIAEAAEVLNLIVKEQKERPLRVPPEPPCMRFT
ncbi:MAG TPA: hypothetical protein VGO11_19665 [Chthoniobacteraceae bacterium]|jgi:hypothetical protein|nr:hypothetical protein [Chthoniobacteraceae bacterium]